jgi:electron transfer flavoprotein-quinone oxidoreductase
MEKFDAIIVGAGLAGLAAAHTLVREGAEVLVLERGDYAGAKNLTGGRLYLNPVRPLFPGLLEKAPLERGIVREEICLLGKKGSVTTSYDARTGQAGLSQSASVLRARFDRWLAKEVEQLGVPIVTKGAVEDLILENGRVKGIVVTGEEIGADVVLACDGVLSLTAEKAGLRKPGSPGHYAVGIKEIVELDEGVIEDRFHVGPGEGAARLFLGEATRGRFGGGFLYTNRTSVSVGIVLGIDALEGKPGEPTAPEIFDAFKNRPEVQSLLRGGQTVEYGAHVIPEGGVAAVGKLCGDGILVAGDAAGFALNTGLIVRGMDYALASGYWAARAFLEAKGRNDFSAASLACYEAFLRDSFVLKDFETARHAPEALRNPRFYGHYPDFALGILEDLFAVPAGPKEKLFATARRHLPLREVLALLRDMKGMMKI